MNKMVDEYTKNVVSSLKTVAGKAYKDGLKDAINLFYNMIE